MTQGHTKARILMRASAYKNEGIFQKKWRSQCILSSEQVRGIISRSRTLSCRICGKRGAVGHHSDYRRPFDVWWLCNKHHGKWHAIFMTEDYDIPNTEAEIEWIMERARNRLYRRFTIAMIAVYLHISSS